MLTRSLSKLILQSPTGMLSLAYIQDPSRSQIIASLNEPRNHFLSLPQELLVHILNLLSISDIGNLCLSGSMELRDRIITWIQSRSFANKVRGYLLEDAGDREEECVDKWIEVNGQFGVLAKRASMIFTTSYRLRLLSKWYENIEEIVPDCSSSSHWKKLLNRIGLGSALATFSLGWDEVEYNKILGWLRDMEDVHFQGDLRRILRIYFWQFINSDQTKASWLTFMLKTFATPNANCPSVIKEYQAAEFLLCLFGPTDMYSNDDLSNFKHEALGRLSGKPNYTLLDRAFPGGYHEAKGIFADLGKALSTLLRCKSINKRFLGDIIDSMFNCFFWNIDNQAACLLFSCEKLVKLYLSRVVNKEGVEKFAQLLVSLIVVCGRLSNHLNQGLDKILDWAIKLPDYELLENFCEELWRVFSSRIQLENLSADTVTQFGSFVTMLACQASKGVASVHMEVEE